ncbi:MAG: Na/Pi symporter [gamma proteobacterium symbiont of Bathyaustriella thionipta]|nr:Na/Pi symporter [gamma proteobacterium symbiont of Bathyaustriella thionipta]
MLRKILLPTIFILLGWGFWISPDFKEIAAGVSIFLFGMLSLEEGFRAFTGGTLESILKNTTNKLWKSLSFGVVTTSLMQSSSLVSVIAISFLSAGLIGLTAGVGIIFGANIGTTTGAWLIAGFGLKVKISAYAMPMLVFGVLLLFQKNKSLKGIGYILTGLGFLFLGIHYMKDGFESFKDSFDLAQYAVAGYPGLFLFTAIGIAATVIMQSSHATLVLTITALAAGQITYDNGLALAIGANVGTTITAIIGSLSSNEQGKRLAAAHLVFNLVTGLIAIIFIYQMMASVDWISEHVGIAQDDYTLKLAVFHTLFNIIGVLVMLPLMKKLVSLLEGMFIPREVPLSKPKFLHDSAADFPDTALEAIRQETLRVWDHSIDIFAHAFGFTREQLISDTDLANIARQQKHLPEFDVEMAYELRVKPLFSSIVTFIAQAGLSSENEQSGDVYWLRTANQQMVEAIKAAKHLRTNLSITVQSGDRMRREIYDNMRVQLSLLIRQLEAIRQSSPEDSPVLSLDYMRLALHEHCQLLNTRMANAMREGTMSGSVATSLLNDSNYAQEVFRTLVDMGETLFVRHNRSLSDAEREVLLSDDELHALES